MGTGSQWWPGLILHIPGLRHQGFYYVLAEGEAPPIAAYGAVVAGGEVRGFLGRWQAISFASPSGAPPPPTAGLPAGSVEPHHSERGPAYLARPDAGASGQVSRRKAEAPMLGVGSGGVKG